MRCRAPQCYVNGYRFSTALRILSPCVEFCTQNEGKRRADLAASHSPSAGRHAPQCRPVRLRPGRGALPFAQPRQLRAAHSAPLPFLRLPVSALLRFGSTASPALTVRLVVAVLSSALRLFSAGVRSLSRPLNVRCWGRHSQAEFLRPGGCTFRRLLRASARRQQLVTGSPCPARKTAAFFSPPRPGCPAAVHIWSGGRLRSLASVPAGGDWPSRSLPPCGRPRLQPVPLLWWPCRYSAFHSPPCRADADAAALCCAVLSGCVLTRLARFRDAPAGVLHFLWSLQLIKR